MNLYTQIIWLFILAIPIACISWTFTHEELFREPREYCVNRSQHDKAFIKRKFFFLFTCEYCFSHYVTLLFIILTDYKLLLNDWRGYIIAGFSVVWVANFYMSVFAFLRQNIKKEITKIKVLEKETQ